MRRVVSLYLPRWPTDRWRRKHGGGSPPDKPLVMAMRHGQQRLVSSVDEAAARAGLSVGMTVTHAQSLVAGLTVTHAAPDEDRKALTRLAFWCTRYAPLVTPDPPDGVFFDVAGSAHFFRGEAALIDDLINRLEGAGLSARAAVADTPGCAWAVTRFSNQRIVSAGRASEAIASLPVAALRLPDQTVSSLRDVGIERVAQLASKPRATVPVRFGATVLTRLDQALGSAEEVLVSLIPPELPRCELRFAEPLGDAQDLQRVIALLAGKLCHELERKGIGARRLDLAFMRVDNIAQAVRVGLSRPNREPKHLAKLLSERLVMIDPGFGIELAAETISVMLAVFARVDPALRKSITFDNDTAFAQHALLRTMRAMTTWFCDAYASWQKGGVENANGRLRHWLPRQIDIDKVSDEEIQDIVMTANLTPRKCMGFKTPLRAILKELGTDVQIRFA